MSSSDSENDNPDDDPIVNSTGARIFNVLIGLTIIALAVVVWFDTALFAPAAELGMATRFLILAVASGGGLFIWRTLRRKSK